MKTHLAEYQPSPSRLSWSFFGLLARRSKLSKTKIDGSISISFWNISFQSRCNVSTFFPERLEALHDFWADVGVENKYLSVKNSQCTQNGRNKDKNPTLYTGIWR